MDTSNTDISGATGSTYTLVAAVQGKKLLVRVSFSNDNNAHTLESADAGVIAADTTPPDPVAQVRVTHNGSSLSVSWDGAAAGDPLRRDLQRRWGQRLGGVEPRRYQPDHHLRQ